jgi:glucose/arabinose dehydrogenase
MRLQRSCFDSAARYYPTSRFSDRTLIIRHAGGMGERYAAAEDTVSDVAPQHETRSIAVGGKGQLFVSVPDPNAKM